MSAGQAAKLSLEDVSQRFGETEALAPTDLEIGAGEFVVRRRALRLRQEHALQHRRRRRQADRAAGC